MAVDVNRLYVNLEVGLYEDYARERITGQIEVEQNCDLMDYFKRPEHIKLAAGAAATLVPLPIGATTIRFIAIHNLTVASGVRLRFDGAANSPHLVYPPDDNATQAAFVSYCSHTSLYVDNPSSTDAVEFDLMLGCK